MVFTRQAQVPGRTDFRPVAATAALPPLKSVRLLDQLRERIRLLHYSLRTEEAYVYWARAFIRFHGLRHPAEMGKAEVEGFLMHLAAQKGLSASTHRQALSALIFLYDKVLGLQLPWLAEIGRPVPVRRLPVVLSRDEVTAVLGGLQGVHRVLARLLYGTGMRISEALQLRVKDVDFAHRALMVREGKGVVVVRCHVGPGSKAAGGCGEDRGGAVRGGRTRQAAGSRQSRRRGGTRQSRRHRRRAVARAKSGLWPRPHVAARLGHAKVYCAQ